MKLAKRKARRPHGAAKALEDAVYIHNICILTALDSERTGIDPEVDQMFWTEMYQDKLSQGDVDAACIYFNMAQRAGR